MISNRVAPLFLLLAGCAVQTPQADIMTAPQVPPPAVDSVAAPQPDAVLRETPPKPRPSLGPATFEGRYEQGGWIRGLAPPGTGSVTLDGEPLEFDASDRRFFVGIDRDATGEAVLVFTARDGQTRTHRLEIAPRDWDIEHVNVARRTGGPSESFMRRRRPELAAIWTAREEDTGADGWRQEFIWPATGRISGRFGSQRIYRGEPGSYHSGLDIAGGAGATYVAPADGVVVLAEPDFSLEGQLLIIDHGRGLNSAFLHSSNLQVRDGQVVKQGQPLGRIGSSGRATGPHLHWSLMWRDKRLDPLLFLPPMP